MTSTDRMQVGFRDIASFAAGVLVPMLLICTALIIALSVYAGAGAGPGITVGMMAGLVLAMALEILRRYVLMTRALMTRALTTRARGARAAVSFLRGLIWMVIAGAPLVMVFVAAGVFKPCFGQACDTLSRLVMQYMLACCVISLLLVPLGYRLLKRAVWLQP